MNYMILLPPVQMLEYGNALRTHKAVPVNSNKDIDQIMSQLSSDPKVKLDEVTSLIVTSEAMDEFPQFMIMKAVQLPADKKDSLIDFVSSVTRKKANVIGTCLAH